MIIDKMILGFSIVTNYSLWFVVLCVLLAFAYSFLLYRRDKNFDEVSKLKIKLMFAFRFMSVFILSFLLLSPLFKSINKNIEKPIIILAQDNSESILVNKDSSYYKTEYIQSINELKNKLSEKYEVKQYTFGEEINSDNNIDYSEKLSDYSNLLKEIDNKYINRNVGALIVAGDGMYNKGSNPIYATGDINFPIYTLALGDTAVQKDIVLSNIRNNKIAFLGNKFPVEIIVDAKILKGENTTLTIYNNNRSVFSKRINVSSDDYTQEIVAELEASKIGVQRYKVELSTVENEISINNNVKDFIIDVIDSKQKVLILANSPHPDIAALKRAIDKNINFELEYYVVTDFKKDIKDYNLVIFHQLPSVNNSISTILSDLNKYKVPGMFITGNQTSYPNLNNFNSGFYLKQTNAKGEEAQPSFNDKFLTFEINDETKEFIQSAPPLVTAFGEYNNIPISDVLFYQKLRGVATSKPLFYFYNNDDSKFCYICGEGLWRWRIQDYKINSNHNTFDELINKTVQYLSVQVNKDNFNVNSNNIFSENENIIIEAELYNESFELVNTPDVNLEITNSENKSYNFAFSKTGNSYRLNAGIFPVGDYNYTAKVEHGENSYTDKGSFSVIPINIEANNTIANHKLLYQLSSKNGGKMYYPAELNNLFNDISNNQNIVSIEHTEKNLIDLINLKWIFFLVLLLISAEWFMRKYFGSY